MTYTLCIKTLWEKSWEANSAKPIENDSTTASIVVLPNRYIFWAGNSSTHPVKKDVKLSETVNNFAIYKNWLCLQKVSHIVIINS